MLIQNAASGNIIGGTTPAARDVISGNRWEGVHIVGTGMADNETSDNMVEGDYIGLSADGSAMLPNAESGVGLYAGASGNTIGGSVAGAGDVISGNGSNGVYITDEGTDANVVAGDLIGTDVTGMNAMPNADCGVWITNAGADNAGNIIGGATPATRDVISGNNWDGVHIVNGSTGNTVEGDYIGLNASGTAALANAQSGVAIYGDATANTIGGSVAGAGDVISGNNASGVYISDSGTTGNTVAGDLIGTDPTGSFAKPNYDGVLVQSGASGNIIGGTTPDARDVISGNTRDGVHIVNGASGNTVAGDYIGVAANGSAALANKASGVAIYGGATANTIGGSVTGARDVISGNTGDGLYITDGGTENNRIEGDFIGTDASGANALPNNVGLYFGGGANHNTVGGSVAGAGDVISGNTTDGVQVFGNGTDDNQLAGDDIGVTADGSGALANGGNGVAVYAGASDNTIGGPWPGDRDVISANTGNGVYISDAGTNGNVVAGDYIGTDWTGSKPLGNGQNGVIIQSGAAGNEVEAANVISANALSGVLIFGSGTNGNLVAGNFIGTDATGSNRLGNTLDGAVVTFGASSNTIGGTTAATRNVISANGNDGILISGSGTKSNLVQGNYVGTDASGMNALGNVVNGVSINAGASDNTIGGSLDASNLIEFNGDNGVEVEDTGTTGNTITYDTIDNNTVNGVFLSGVSGNTVASCTLDDNRGWGILDTTGQNSLSNNVFNNNGKGTVGS